MYYALCPYPQIVSCSDFQEDGHTFKCIIMVNEKVEVYGIYILYYIE